MKRTIFFIIWSGICVIVVFFLWKLPSNQWEYSGNNVTFNTSDQMQVTTEKSSTIEAVSGNYFLLRNKNTSEVISALPAPKPLGWIYEEYYTVGPVELGAGTWVVEIGSFINVRLSADTDIKAVESRDDYAQKSGYIFFFIVGLVIWLIGLVIRSML